MLHFLFQGDCNYRNLLSSWQLTKLRSVLPHLTGMYIAKAEPLRTYVVKHFRFFLYRNSTVERFSAKFCTPRVWYLYYCGLVIKVTRTDFLSGQWGLFGLHDFLPIVLLFNFACSLHIYNICLRGHSGLLVPLWLWIKEVSYDADIVSENFPRWVIPYVKDGLGGSDKHWYDRTLLWRM
jgi:hypothetical protein